MTNTQTPITLRPVPAVPIVVVSTTEGACGVLACGGLFQGPTLCAVLDGVCKFSAYALEKKG